MSAENLLLLSPDELPQTDEPKRPKRKPFQNILSIQLYRLMNYFKVEQAHIVKATGIAYPTLSGWANSEVETQMLDSNLKAVANFFQVSIDFMGYGVPMTDRDLELDDLMDDFDGGDGYSTLVKNESA